MKSTLNNGLFTGLQGETKEKLGRLAQDTRINLCSTVMLMPWREVVPIAEALVAWDTKTDKIVRFISAFIPAMPGVDKGKWFKIHRDLKPAAPIPIEPDASLQPAWLELAKMPSNLDGLEFRLLRAYRHDVNRVARFQILNFDRPSPPVTMVNRKTIRVELEFNSSPIFDLNKIWWHEQILKAMSKFSGVPLLTQTDVKAELQRQAATGAISAGVANELIHANDEAFEPGLPSRVGQEVLAAMQEAQPHHDEDMARVGQDALAHMQVAGAQIESVETTVASAVEEAISEIGFAAEDEIPHNPLAAGYIQPEEEPVAQAEDDVEVELPM